MSGHSKWSTIKRQKGSQDAKRGQIFTKLSNAITLAVKQSAGLTDPQNNFKLRLAIDRAKSANMPKENIERAISRARGSGVEAVEELLYEGFAPGGIAVLVEVVTDNKQRIAPLIKNIFEKSGGRLGTPGSVSYLFKKRGEIIVRKNGISEGELLEKGIKAGVEDMEEEHNYTFFYTDPKSLQKVKNSLLEEGLEIENTKLTFLPIAYIKLDEEKQREVLNLIDNLEELDDVQEVYTNLE